MKKCSDTIRRLKHTFGNMKLRCYDENDASYKYYGDRGIKIYDKWLLDVNSFCKWAIEHGYEEGLSIDRIDNDANYCPENCRWVNRKIQNNNTRANRIIEYNGEQLTLSEISDKYNINYDCLKGRLDRGFSVNEAIEIPVERYRKPLLMTAFGETKNLSDWAKDSRCVVNRRTLSLRVRQLAWNLEDALVTPPNRLANVLAFGEEKSIAEWSKDTRCQVRYPTLKYRIMNANWNPEKAITTPTWKTQENSDMIYE